MGAPPPTTDTMQRVEVRSDFGSGLGIIGRTGRCLTGRPRVWFDRPGEHSGQVTLASNLQGAMPTALRGHAHAKPWAWPPAMRGVGNEESIGLIGALPKLSGPWSGLESSACKAIRKRLKSD